MNKRNYAPAILNVLMNAGDYVTTKQIVERVGCERKSVYSNIAVLECNGFGIDVIEKRGEGNRYKYIGLYGLGANQ